MGQTGRGNGDREERTELQFGSRGVIGEFDAGTESTKHISESLIGKTNHSRYFKQRELYSSKELCSWEGWEARQDGEAAQWLATAGYLYCNTQS